MGEQPGARPISVWLQRTCVGDRVAWRSHDGTLQSEALVVEADALTIVAYHSARMHVFRLRGDGFYWADWCAEDEKKNGRLLSIVRTRRGGQ